MQSNGGAKNYIVVMPDADVPKTVEALSTAAFGCAGERCMAGSTAITVGAAAERLLPTLVDAARAIKPSWRDELEITACISQVLDPIVLRHTRLGLIARGTMQLCPICRLQAAVDAYAGSWGPRLTVPSTSSIPRSPESTR